MIHGSYELKHIMPIWHCKAVSCILAFFDVISTLLRHGQRWLCCILTLQSSVVRVWPSCILFAAFEVIKTEVYVLDVALMCCFCLSITLIFASSTSDSGPRGAPPKLISDVASSLLRGSSLLSFAELESNEKTLIVSASFCCMSFLVNISPVRGLIRELGRGGGGGNTGS